MEMNDPGGVNPALRFECELCVQFRDDPAGYPLYIPVPVFLGLLDGIECGARLFADIL